MTAFQKEQRAFVEYKAEIAEFLEAERTGNWARQDGPYRVVKINDEWSKLYQLKPGEVTHIFIPA